MSKKTESTIEHFEAAVPAEKWASAANAQAHAMEADAQEGIVDNPEEVLVAAAKWRTAAARADRARELSEGGYHDDAYLVSAGLAD